MNIQIRNAEATDVPAISDLLRSIGIFDHINAEAPQTN